MAEPRERAWALDEFFAWQERQPDRYELVSGRPLKMMVGVKNVHDLIVVNILVTLKSKLQTFGYRPFTGESAMETYPGQIRRPDVGVDCGKFDPNAYKATAPRLVAEVLSPSTRDFDTFGKLEGYKSVATLGYIMFVEPNAPSVALLSRGEGGGWVESRVEGLDAKIDLHAPGAALELRALYEGVEFPNSPRLVTFEPSRSTG